MENSVRWMKLKSLLLCVVLKMILLLYNTHMEVIQVCIKFVMDRIESNWVIIKNFFLKNMFKNKQILQPRSLCLQHGGVKIPMANLF